MDKRLEYDWNRHVGAATFGKIEGKGTMIVPVDLLIKVDLAIKEEETEAALDAQQLEDAHSQLDLLGIPALEGKQRHTAAGRLGILNQILMESNKELRDLYLKAVHAYKSKAPVE